LTADGHLALDDVDHLVTVMRMGRQHDARIVARIRDGAIVGDVDEAIPHRSAAVADLL